jgi:hypothetical protein
MCTRYHQATETQLNQGTIKVEPTEMKKGVRAKNATPAALVENQLLSRTVVDVHDRPGASLEYFLRVEDM